MFLFKKNRKRFIMNMDFIHGFLKKMMPYIFFKYGFKKENMTHYNVKVD